jgi:hypothetical protein
LQPINYYQMKKITGVLLLICISTILFSQNVKKINGLKDAWGVEYNYTGEIKDGKPNGIGVATYTNTSVLRYAGSFSNGMYSGKGTIFFTDGIFLTGNWKNGKLNGKGANFTSNKSLYIGDFADGQKNGKGVFINSNNDIYLGTYLNDKLHGRSLAVWNSGNIISDAEYREDKRNGVGYQYEVKSKKLFEGEWKDDKWVQTATPGFSSFLKSPVLKSEMSNDRILVGTTNSAGKMIDSSYYYDLVKKKKYIGYFENGSLRSGLILRDDSTVFYGTLNDKGASGYGYSFKFNNYYSEGNYVNDLLSGMVTDIDLAKKTVYYGNAVDGKFSGKANFINGSGTIFSGDYVSGRFTGNGFKLETNGRYTLGSWEDGQVKKLTTVITPEGDVISGMPKTFADGLNSVIRTYPNLFGDIFGDIVDDEELSEEMEELSLDYFPDFNYSLITLPGSIGKNLVADDYDGTFYYYARFLQTDNVAKAKAKYNELHNLILAAPIGSNMLTGKQKLTGKLEPANLTGNITETKYSLSGDDNDFLDCKVWLRLRQVGNEYIVEIMVGEKPDDY